MITTADKRLFEACSSLRNRGLDVSAGYEIFNKIGSNRRMAEFQAILGRAQLKRLEQFLIHRNTIAKIYKEELRELAQKGIVSFQEYPQHIRHSYWRFVVFLNKKGIKPQNIQSAGAKAGIKIDFPYSPLLHLQPAFKNKKRFVHAEARAQKHFCMPIHMLISESDARYIGKTIRKIIE